MINQINGVYRIRKEHLEKLCGEVYDETKFYEKVEFRHRSRNNEYIRMCDKICNEILSKNGV